MLKIISILIIFLCISYIGFYYGEKFKRRSKQLKVIFKSILFLNNEVMYSNTPLPEALNYIALKVDKPISNLLFNVGLKLESGELGSVYEAFKDEYARNKDDFNLNYEDTNLIKDFLKGLGESGIYGQDKLFNLTIENMKNHCNEADELAKKNSKMYSVIGVCMGAIIAIFLF